jgi:restriction system protein
LWLDLSEQTGDNVLDDLLNRLHNQRENYRYESGMTVVVDGSDIWSQKQHKVAAGRIFNYKAVSSLVFIRQRPVKLARSQQLHLGPLSTSSTGDLLRKLLATDLTNDQIEKAILTSNGFPLAISILSKLLDGKNIESILSSDEKPLYELSGNILVPQKEIFSSVTPILMLNFCVKNSFILIPIVSTTFTRLLNLKSFPYSYLPYCARSNPCSYANVSYLGNFTPSTV